METRKVEPDPGSTEQQPREQRRRATRRKTGLFAFVAASGVVATVVALRMLPDDGTRALIGPSVARPTTTTGLFNYVDLRTGATTPLPDNIADSWSLLSPDGSMFVYVRHGSMFVANVDGSNERQMTPEGVRAGLGGWSPDGSTIVYERFAGGRKLGNVFTVDLATRGTTQLTDLEELKTWTDVTAMEPAFSPDGQTVFFHRPRLAARLWDIWSVPVTGGEPTILRRNAGWGRYSPDGQTFAFLTDNTEGGQIMIADATGGPARELVENQPWNGPPIWSPDGTRIAYVGHGIQIVDVATGATSRVVVCGGPVEWFDDDTLIVGPGGC